jgi:hypothetical protein
VLNWLGKVLGGGAKQAEGVPASWARQLESLLEKADQLKGIGRRGLGRDLAGYVLREDPIAVLAEVGRSDALGALFGLTWGMAGKDNGELSRRLYPGMHALPPAVVVRWGQLIVTSVAARMSHWRLTLPPDAVWAEALMEHAGAEWVNSRTPGTPSPCELPLPVVEAALEAAGHPPATLLVACFATPLAGASWIAPRLKVIRRMPGYADAVARHREALQPHLLPSSVDQRLHVLDMLGALDDAGLAAFAGEIAEHGASSSKQVRAAAEALARRIAPGMTAPLSALATAGKPEQRLNALRLLYTLGAASGDAAVQAWVRETALADKAPSVQALPSEWEVQAQAGTAELQSYDYELPAIHWQVAMTPELDRQLELFWQDLNASVERSNRSSREHHERSTAAGHRYPLRLEEAYSASGLATLRASLATADARFKRLRDKTRNVWVHVGPAVQRLARHPSVTVPVVLKVLASFDLLVANGQGLTRPATEAIDSVHRRTGHPSLLELSLYLDAMERKGGVEVIHSYLSSHGALARDWDADKVWPFFAHHQEQLIRLLDPTARREYFLDRSAIFRAVATLPSPPARVVNALFDLALTGGRAEREPAQAALHALPGKEARIVNALADGKAEVRAVAAQWLQRLDHAAAIPALEVAVAKEKHDLPKGAMLDALQAMGQPVEKYVGRSALAAEAAKSLAKGTPKELEWFPWAALPAVHWADNSEPVPPDVLRWLLAQAVRLKTPEPNAVLRKYCGMFAPREREAFGQFVLEAWLAEDTRPHPPEVAMQQARTSASQMFQSIKSHPQYYDDALKGKTLEELIAMHLPGHLRQPVGSAIGSKGLLAVAAACAAERAAPPVQRYLKEWYGTRAAQGKALVAMLAWIDHPGATQLMLSVGNRFRTKGIQDEATRQAAALADRRGWTLQELADRTMPSAGFDGDGVLELSYGERVFTARLLPDFKVELFNPDGKKIAALPEPRQDDDAERAKEARKAFAAAKKEIKSVVDLQTDRLYEALCTGRDWSYEDWHAYLNQHPVVRRLVQRLVWGVVEGGQVTATFRPLDDGTLTDNDDNAVQPAADARIRVAHDSNLAAADVGKWLAHLKDYEVKPLFQQFGKGTWTLPDDKRRESAVMDFQGHLIEAFALRGRAGKLGYVRGSTEDGGWFMTYEKRFPTLGLVAVIEFTGNPLPEENRTVALIQLSFAGTQGDNRWERASLALSEVPPVLLSECYNDLRLIAADGTGFDPEWQKKSEY